jgi:hypothetical protein
MCKDRLVIIIIFGSQKGDEKCARKKKRFCRNKNEIAKENMLLMAYI